MKAARQNWPAWLVALLLAAAGSSAAAQNSNGRGGDRTAAPAVLASTNAPRMSPPAGPSSSRDREVSSASFDESAFRIVSERNVFNANRSGGQVRPTSSRRPARVESFTLVGTIAYEQGAFAFFQGSSSELTKVLKPAGTIAGHKVVDILADGVTLEADGKTVELEVGSAMRREDEGAWKPGEAVAGSSGNSSRGDDDDAARSRGWDDRRSSSSTASSSAPLTESYKQDRKEEKREAKLDAKAEADILKRLMERRERESQ